MLSILYIRPTYSFRTSFKFNEVHKPIDQNNDDCVNRYSQVIHLSCRQLNFHNPHFIINFKDFRFRDIVRLPLATDIQLSSAGINIDFIIELTGLTRLFANKRSSIIVVTGIDFIITRLQESVEVRRIRIRLSLNINTCFCQENNNINIFTSQLNVLRIAFRLLCSC